MIRRYFGYDYWGGRLEVHRRWLKSAGKMGDMRNPELSAVSLRDVLYLRTVRNNADVRRNAGNLSEVGLFQHLIWYARNATWIHRHSFVVITNSQRAGYVRLTPSGDSVVRISIAIEPWAQGQGLGTQTLLWVVKRCERMGGLRSIEAQVHRANFQSLAAFTRAGFITQEVSATSELLVLARPMPMAHD